MRVEVLIHPSPLRGGMRAIASRVGVFLVSVLFAAEKAETKYTPTPTPPLKGEGL